MDKKEYRKYAVQSANGDATAFAKLYGLINRNMYYTAFYTLKTEKEAVSAVTEQRTAALHIYDESAVCEDKGCFKALSRQFSRRRPARNKRAVF